MNFFARNVLLINIVALVAALGWIHGGTRADLILHVVPWLSLMVLMWLLVFPEARRNEGLVESRERVWYALKRDPFMYLSLVWLVFLVIPFFNVAEIPEISPETGLAAATYSPIRWLPGCSDIEAHAVMLLWFPPVCIAVLAARHGLLKRSKRRLLEVICWNAALLAVLGFAQLMSGTSKLLWITPLPSYFFSTFGYPNFAGAFFTLTFALSYGVWFQHVTESSGYAAVRTGDINPDGIKVLHHRMLVPTTLCFIAAYASLSRAAILLTTLVFIAMTAVMLRYVWRNLRPAIRMIVLTSLFAVVVGGVGSITLFKLDELRKEIKTITPEAVIQRVSGSGQYHKRVALCIANEYPLFGVGGWGYPHYKYVFMTPEDLVKMQQVGGANVHSDYVQFMAEHGYVGFGILVLMVLSLSVPMFWQSWRVAKNIKQEAGKNVVPGEKPRTLLASLSAPVIGVVAGTTATVCHSLGDLPFRAPSILIIWILAFVCVTGWLPELKRR